jgi:hypothetical protein
MKKTRQLLEGGFESSSTKTPEFKAFAKVFKKEFTQELKTINCTNIKFSVGHFYISGFFTDETTQQAYYFSIPDVRELSYGIFHNPNSSMNMLLYRTAKDYKDYTGGMNRYARIEVGIANVIGRYF